MRYNNIKLVSLNVNGMNNPVKKVLAKIKKEKAQVLFLQETHLPQQEHDKLKRFGFNLLSPEPVFQVSGLKMTFPEQMTISSLLKGLN